MKYIIIILVFISSINLCYAQWTPTNGPVSRIIIDDLFRYDNVDYISVRGCGLFSKELNEDNWSHLSNYWFDSHTLFGDSLFVSVNHLSGGLIRDKGTFFMNISDGIDFTNQILQYGLSNINHTNSHLYSGSSTHIYRFDFDGTNRMEISQDLPQFGIAGPGAQLTSFAMTQEYLLCGTKQGFFKSKIDDIDWKNYSQGLESGPVLEVSENKGKFYCVVNSKLYESDDGQLWNVVYSASSNINLLHFASDTILIGQDLSGLLFSIDEGISWESYHSDIIENQIIDIIELNGNLFFITNEEGVYQIRNGEWEDHNSNLVCSIIRDIDVVGNKLITVDWKSIDILSNSEWLNITPESINFTGFGSLTSMGDTIFLSVHYNNNFISNHFIIFSFDNGNNWNQLYNNPPEVGDDAYRIIAIGSRLYVSENSFIYYTDDLGIQWHEIILPNKYCNLIDELINHDSQLYIRTCGNREVLKLDQEEGQWLEMTLNLPDQDVSDLIFTDKFMIAKVFGEGLYISLIDNDEWRTLFEYPESLANIDIRIKDYVYKDSFLFISTNEGVFVSSDDGLSFSTYNEGLININTSEIEILNDTLYLGTIGNGVWKRYINKNDLPPPQSYLQFNPQILLYPNPASDIIHIETENNNPIKIDIYNTIGKMVRSSKISDKKLNLNGLESGTYYLSIVTDMNHFTRKIVVLK